MIRYRVSDAELRRRIDRESATWLTRALAKTDVVADKGCFLAQGGPDWSEIKAVYMALQHNKCAYCERKLESHDLGKIEHDVEHFRPKNAVLEWPDRAARRRGISYQFSTGSAHPAGYYLLAYHPFNYATACKTCNTLLKSNYFPIAGARVSGSREPADYRTELPYLIYPLGTSGPDPEKIIRFAGVIAIPRYRSGHRHRMGRVIIDFFALNEREHLRRERACEIEAIYMAFMLRQDDDLARDIIRQRTSPHAPHASCNRNFLRLCEDQPAHARELFEQAHELMSRSR